MSLPKHLQQISGSLCTDCQLLSQALAIAWEALQKIKVVDVEFKEDLAGLQKTFAAEAMRRIEALGK